MASQLDIYNANLQASKNRQPRHQLDVKELESALASLPAAHPYELEANNFEHFKPISAYRKTCAGLRGTLGGQFCYRLTSVWKLQRNTEGLVLRSLSNITPEDGFTRISRDYIANGSQWMPLGRFIGGRYSGPRSVTWWTTTEPSPQDLQCAGHRMGLLNSDIALETIVLRCPTEYIRIHKLAFVPTVVDAFFLEIFEATFESSQPPSGFTIDVENPLSLKHGVPEYVLPPLDIDQAGIELMPVDLRLKEPSHKVYRDDVSDSLLAYYRALP